MTAARHGFATGRRRRLHGERRLDERRLDDRRLDEGRARPTPRRTTPRRRTPRRTTPRRRTRPRPTRCRPTARRAPAASRRSSAARGLYSDWATKTVASGVRQYDPGLHLWSDGASKTRWIYLPPGTKIDTTDMNEWTFPPGTKIWKEFVVGGVAAGDAAHLEAPQRRLVLHGVSLVGRWSVEHHRAHRRRAGRRRERLRDPHPERLLRLPQRPPRRGAGLRSGGALDVPGLRRDDGDPHRRQPPHRPAHQPAEDPRRRDLRRRARLSAHELRRQLPQPRRRPGRVHERPRCGSTTRRWPA